VRLSPTAFAYLVAGTLAIVEGSLGVLLAPYLQANGFSLAAIGGFVALYALAGLLSRLPGGRWYRPGWIRPLLILALLLQILANWMYPLFQDGLVLAVVRVVSGFAYGLGTTINLAQFLDSLPPGRPRDRPTAYYTAIISLGFATGNVTGGFLGELWGYAGGFVGVTIFPIIAIVAGLLAQEPATVRAPARPRASPREVLAALGEPLLLIVMVEYMVLNFLFGMHYALFPLYLLAVGAVLGQLGVIRGLFSGAQIASRVGAGWLTARFGHRPVAAFAVAGQAAVLALVAGTGDLLVLTILSLCYGALRGVALMANTLGLAEASDRSTLSRGASSGAYNAASDVGILIGPIAAGAAAGTIGISAAFVVLPLGILAVYLLSVWVNGRRAGMVKSGP
jgi:predicted MFS family arabinose efflux permease